MTLIVGMRCTDGVVIGADGASTYATTGGQRTILQPTRKIEIIEKKVIAAVSGSVGLGQRFTEAVRVACAEGKLADKSPVECMCVLSQQMRPHALQEIDVVRQAQAVLGQAAVMSLVSSSVIALPVGERSELFQFDWLCTPERATDHNPFVTIGSGQPIADPFLAFLRRIFWPDKPPSLPDGVFAVFWTLQHAIQTNPGGVAGPIQIVTLDGNGAEELDPADLEEHKASVAAAEERLRSFRSDLVAETAERAPMPPQNR